ncbi:hypothetical protein AB6A40_001765 [Gnathostoma spinigerum]|uniref:PH domain-containing protein n=1 Tax=Gnathostoma spinigerum TaxID=75299 RepID=A0ABD6ECF9_9BILA
MSHILLHWRGLIMRTKIPLEELLDDTPQNRSLIRLFEEDTYNLRSWAHQLDTALENLSNAQKAATDATASLINIIAAYKNQKFPLEEAAYDMPAVTDRIAHTLSEVNSWMDLLTQQLDKCVRYPVSKMTNELDHIVEILRPRFADAASGMTEAEERFARSSRKDSVRKLEEVNNDVFISKLNFHKLSLSYSTRMNSLQYSRYTRLIEPLVALVCAWRSLFNAGYDAFKSETLTNFLTHTQEQMQSIDKDAEEEEKEERQLLITLADLPKLDRDIYYGERSEQTVLPSYDDLQRQGYLRIKMKTGLFSNNWDRYFVFTQGANLMWQRADDLVGSLMLDLTEIPGTSAQAVGENVDRRFVFAICVPLEDGQSGFARRWLVQAANTVDMYQWISVINNLAGSQFKSKNPSESLTSSECGDVVQSHNTDAAPPDTNVPVQSHDDDLKNVEPPGGQPIQFDLLSANEPSSINVAEIMAGGKSLCFDVRFLGCVEVATDQGGDRLTQSVIEKVLEARLAHSIVASTTCKMLIDEDSHSVLLFDRENISQIR